MIAVSKVPHLLVFGCNVGCEMFVVVWRSKKKWEKALCFIYAGVIFCSKNNFIVSYWEVHNKWQQICRKSYTAWRSKESVVLLAKVWGHFAWHFPRLHHWLLTVAGWSYSELLHRIIVCGRNWSCYGWSLMVTVPQGRTQEGGGLGLNPPWAWYFTKLYHLRKGD